MEGKKESGGVVLHLDDATGLWPYSGVWFSSVLNFCQ